MNTYFKNSYGCAWLVKNVDNDKALNEIKYIALFIKTIIIFGQSWFINTIQIENYFEILYSAKIM